MSYVIQNFVKYNQYIAITPRFKIFFSLHCINFFLLYFKFSNFFSVTPQIQNFLIFFFAKGLVNFFHRLSINLFGNYVNKVTRVGVYWNFKILDNFFKNKNILHIPLKVTDIFFFNRYLLAIKLINFKLTKTYFKNVFFFIIFFFSEIWNQFHNKTNFYLNFFFFKNNLKLYKFYGGYFLRIYNF